MTEVKPPAVSVVMPVYNVERYVEQAVRSVLAQTFTDWELVIVDDGGTDRSLALCAAFTDPRIRIVRQENRGLAGARNTGITAARGAYVALLDSDDAFLPEKLRLHVAHLMVNPDVGVSFAGADLIDDNGRPIGVQQRPLRGIVSAGQVFQGQAIKNGSIPVFRRQTLEDAALRPAGTDRIWYFDETLRRSEDVECWARIALTTTWAFAGLPDILTLYRVNAGGLSADIIRQLESWDCVYQKIKAYAPGFIARHGNAARARELRYLARRGFQSGDRGLAFRLIAEAIRLYPALLLQEPKKTLTTALACMLLRIVPETPFRAFARAAGAPGYAGAVS